MSVSLEEESDKGENHYVVYNAANRVEALAFLRAREIRQPNYFVVVTFPGESLGKDLIMIYDEPTGEMLEFGERKPLPQLKESKSDCARCGYAVLARIAPASRYMPLVMSVDALKTSSTGLYCPDCPAFWCAFCVVIRNVIPLCQLCNGPLGVQLAEVSEQREVYPLCVVLSADGYAKAIGVPPESPQAISSDLATLDRALAVWEETINQPSFVDLPWSVRLPFVRDLASRERGIYEDTANLERLVAAVRNLGLALDVARKGWPALFQPGNGLRNGRTLSFQPITSQRLDVSNAKRSKWLDDLDSLFELQKLSTWLSDLYDVSGNLDHLDRAIETATEALGLGTFAYERTDLQNQIGLSLRQRYYHSGQSADLDAAIDFLADAVRSDPTSTTYLSGLGNALRDRYSIRGDVRDLRSSIQYFEDAMKKLAGSGDKDLPMLATNLAISIHSEYELTGQERTLASAIEVLDRTDAPSDVPAFDNIRGVCLQARYRHTGEISDLNAAVEAFRQALERTPRGSPEIGQRCSSLGSALAERYIRLGKLEDLDAAIKEHRAAIDATPDPGSPELPAFLNNVVHALRERYLHSHQSQDLDAIMAFSQEAVALTPLKSPYRPGHLVNRACALIDIYEKTRDEAKLESAIQDLKEAMALCPADSPQRSILLNDLADALKQRYELHSGSPKDLEQIRLLYRKSWESGMEVNPQAALKASSNWGDWALKRQAFSEAGAAYERGLQAADRVFHIQLTRQGKEGWLREAQALPARAAYSLAKSGDLAGAVRALERGRARLLTEALERTRAELDQLSPLGHETLVQRYRAAAQRIAKLESLELSPASIPPGLDITKAQRAARTEQEAAIEALAVIPGYQDLFRTPDLNAVQSCLSQLPTGNLNSLVLVYFVLTPAGGLALIVDREKVHPEWLDITDVELDAMLVQGEGAAINGYLPAQLGMKKTSMHKALNSTLPWVGERLTGPVISALKKLLPSSGLKTDPSERLAVLVPVGRLALLPLHAATFESDGQQRSLIDFFRVVYAPSAKVLALSNQRLSQVPKTPTLLAVGNPLPLPPGTEPLKFAKTEAELVASDFDGQATVLCEKAADASSVLKAMEHATYVHFACHSNFDLDHPIASGLMLAGGEWLTVKDFYVRPLSTMRLAVLSACETAVSDFNNLPEEAIGLPAALLKSGVAGVIGSLWPVDDLSTTLLMSKFYQYHRKGNPQKRRIPLDPSSALHEAQEWMRGVTRDELSELFDQYRKSAQSAPDRPPMSFELAQAQFSEYTMHRDLRPLADPYYWAGFVFFGV